MFSINRNKIYETHYSPKIGVLYNDGLNIAYSYKKHLYSYII